MAGLPSYVAVGDILEEQVDLFAGDDVADVVGLGELAEDHADHLAVDQGGAAAVTRVDGGVDLHADARDILVVGGELDTRDDPLGDREGRAPLGISVGQHSLLDLGQGLCTRHRGPLVEERLILEPEHGQVDARADRHDLGGQLLARLVALDEELAGIRTTWAFVRMRLPSMTTPVPLASCGLCLVQGLVRSGNASWRDLHDRVANLASSASLSAPTAAAKAGVETKKTRPTGHPEIIHRIFIAGLTWLPNTQTNIAPFICLARARERKGRGSALAARPS